MVIIILIELILELLKLEREAGEYGRLQEELEKLKLIEKEIDEKIKKSTVDRSLQELIEQKLHLQKQPQEGGHFIK